MNADKRRWNLVSPAALLIVVGSLANNAMAADVKFQLEEEISRRFSVAEEVTPPKRILDSAFRLTRTLKRPSPSPIILDFKFPQAPACIEESEPLPLPTLVELHIAKGFPSGESCEGIDRDDSYYLAERKMTFGGFSR